MFFAPRFRWLWAHSPFHALQRAAYHAVFARWVTVRHPRVLNECAVLGAELGTGVSIGVHKRVWTPGTAEYQGSRRVFKCEHFVLAVEGLIRRMTAPVTHIFLATDDAAAENTFRAAFGNRLRIRPGVQRVAGGLNEDGTLQEVHIRSPHNPSCSLEDAVDVLTDTLLLCKCKAVLHMDSNVSSALALMNPALDMVHIEDVLG